MLSSVKTEYDLDLLASKVGLMMVTNETNDQLASRVLRRVLLNRSKGLEKSVPRVAGHLGYNYPEIVWEQMSCYLDSFVNILL